MPSVFQGLEGKNYGSIAEACEAVEGLLWNCIGVPIRYPDVDGEFTLGFPRKVLNVWEHDRSAIDIVGHKYQRVQYRDCFEIATPLIERGGFRVIGGELLNNGERAILVLESGDVMDLGNGDSIVNRVVLLSSHDGSGKIELRVTPYHKKSGTAQTLDVAGLSYKHTLNVNQRLAKGRQALRKIEQAWEEFTEGAKRMQTVKLTDAQARAFIAEVLPSKTKEVSTRLENIREDVYGIFKNTGVCRANPVCRGTLFGLVQAVAEYTDHSATIRASEKRNERTCNFDSKILNDGAKKKGKAMAAALRLLKMHKALRK